MKQAEAIQKPIKIIRKKAFCRAQNTQKVGVYTKAAACYLMNMTEDLLRYDLMIEAALRNVVRETLATVAQNGLPGDHHFYITFLTNFPGVDIPDYLRKQYADEMT